MSFAGKSLAGHRSKGSQIQRPVTMGGMGAEDEDAIHFLLIEKAKEANLHSVVGICLHQHAADLVDAGVWDVQIKLSRQATLRDKCENGFGPGNPDDVATAGRHVHDGFLGIFDARRVHRIFHLEPTFTVVHERFFLAQVGRLTEICPHVQRDVPFQVFAEES